MADSQPFDPDAYIAANNNQAQLAAFDPDAYIRENTPFSLYDTVTNAANQVIPSTKRLLSIPPKVASTVANALSTPENAYKSTGDYWPGAGAAAGEMLGGPPGAVAGATMGQVARTAAGLVYDDPNVPTSPMGAGTQFAAQALAAGIPGAVNLEGMGSSLARRAIGITKGMIKKIPGGVAEATAKAGTMLDQGAVSPIASRSLKFSENALQNSGQAIGNILNSVGAPAVDLSDVSGQIYDQLAPNVTPNAAGEWPGVYAKDGQILNEIMNTVGAHGNGPVTLDEANALKTRLGTEAGDNWNTDKLRAAMYQKAYGIVGDSIENGINGASEAGIIPPNVLPEYNKQKAIYGASKVAVNALKDKTAAEAANNILTLRGSLIAAGALATGHVTPALEALGAWETATRFGPGVSANLLKFSSNLASKVPTPVYNMIMSKVISAGPQQFMQTVNPTPQDQGAQQ